MNMEFLHANYLNTTTMIRLNAGAGNTSTVYKLFDRDETVKYISSGLNDDTTALTFWIIFTSAQYVDHIIIQNTNYKAIFVRYDTAGANGNFSLYNNDTTLSIWTNNTQTTLFLYFPTTLVSNCIMIRGTTTMNANEEKYIGEIWISRRAYQLERNPAFNNYKPKGDRKEYTHEMAGGGWVNYVISNHFTADIKLSYVSSTEKDELKEIYDTRNNYIFIPFPTGTSWTKEIFQINWIGDWDFYELSDNAWRTNGYAGSLRLREIPK